ncbi:diacylglycerol kinase (ATP) [Agromyces flavus]|uniref:Diacylglycerol kinase n=1 Tax=Agromyces flavus TaxID=589382 RepID=A0A1H1PN80_9MICO|nr:YegS/Rv2252/BmrU family lipid kinase [Agromyces flavus]MCP2367891.1 diacylglycerol kinase (ATP) [Agromyces flavus]GGI47352.1 sphingosine kinase [Agromyces flavus]SDS12626.1 diacylglycerol kinase [Agromyces flavus]
MTRGPRRLLIAVNPYASFGRNRWVGPAVAERLADEGYEVALLREENFELLRRETQSAFEQGTDGLVVVGGDGMVSMGVNILARTGVPLGVVGAGTGNDFARALGLPHEQPEAGIDALVEALKRPPQTIDLGLVHHGELRTWFACVLSAGFDAVVNERANRMVRPRGPSRYTLALVRELATFRPRRYVMTLDGAHRAQSAMLVSIANTPSLGGGMRIVPHADLSDGLLDVFIVHPLSRLGLISVFPRVFAGEHVDHPAVEFVRARRVRLEADGIVAYADGERIGALPIEVEVVPGALSVFA